MADRMSRKQGGSTKDWVLRAAFGAALAVASGAVAPEATAGPVLVELYTSQGCNMCPPADAVIGRLAQRDDVVALSLNVGYWDYLGWKDMLAKPAHAERQRAYARAQNRRTVFTPQIIVDGLVSHIGGRAEEISASVADRMATPGAATLALSRRGDRVEVEIDGALPPSAAAPATIMAAAYQSAVTYEIGAGENGGASVTYFNVPLTFEPIGVWEGGAQNLSAAWPDEADGVAVFVQQPDANGGAVGEVVAAAKIER